MSSRPRGGAWRVPARTASLSAALGMLACGPVLSLPPVASDQRTVLAVARDAKLLDIIDPSAVNAFLADGELLVRFSVPASQIEGGAEDEVVARVASLGPLEGSCGRCLLPAYDRLQRLLPGDRCPWPVSGAVEAFRAADGDLVTSPVDAVAMSRQLVLERKGQCTCELPEPEPAPASVRVTGVFPDDLYAIRSVIPSETSVLAIGGSHAILIGENGARLETDTQTRLGGIGLSVGTPEAPEFLFVENTGERIRAATVSRFSVEAGRLNWTSVGDLDIHARGVFRDGEGVLVVGGSSGAGSGIEAPSFASCTLAGSCRTTVLGPPCSFGAMLAADPARGLALTSNHGAVKQEDGWRCGPKTPFDLVYGGEPLQLQFFDSAIFARSAVFAEFEATQGARTGRGLAMIPLEGLSRPSGALDFRILRFDLAGAPLTSLVAFPNDDTRALALQGDRAYVLGDSGIEDEFSIGVGPPPVRFPELRRGVRTLKSSNARLFAVLADASLFELESPPRRLYGLRDPAPAARTIGSSEDGSVYAITSTGTFVLDPSGELIVRSRPDLGAPSAVSRRSTGEPLAAFPSASGSAIGRFNLTSGNFTAIATVEAVVTGIAELSPATALLMDAQGQLYVLSGSEPEPVKGAQETAWVTASHGVGWAGGPGRLLRAVETEHGVVVEPNWFDRLVDRRPWLDDPTASVAELVDGRQLCPDRVEVSVSQLYTTGNDPKARAHRALLAGADLVCGASADGGLQLCADPDARSDEQRIEILVGPLNARGLLFQAPDRRTYSNPIEFLIAAAGQGSHWLIGSVHGRIARVELE